MPNAPRIAHIVSHTHWDREWYLSFHEFRVHLVSTMDLVLDALEPDDDFRHFLLDGQTIVLEDYLEIRPEEGDRIARLAAAGALSLGPWYVLPDEFLVSAEATARNLLIGRQVGGEFGRVQKVGYLPDTFGHIAQMPQILREAGIDSFVYTRGNGDEIDELGCEYVWRAPDGSEVMAINQCGGYANAAALGHAELWHAHTRRDIEPQLAVRKIAQLFERLAGSSNGDVWLLMNGSDHLPPQREFGAVLAALREAFPRTEFIHGGLEAYVDAIRAAGTASRRHSGELLGGKHHHILSGVWSARMYLKQQNDTAQSLLSRTLEPLASYAHFCLGQEYPDGLIGCAWKLLLKNHPHDSICGCSTDTVHQEMEPRFAGVIETARRLVRNTLEIAAPMFARREDGDHDITICVANTLPARRSEVIDRLIVITPPAPDVDGLSLLDQNGDPVPFEIVDAVYVERFWGIDYRTEISSEAQRELFESYLEHFGSRMRRKKGDPGLVDCFLRIRFTARDLPPVGHALFRLVACGDGGNQGFPLPSHRGPGDAGVRVDGSALENSRVRVRLHSNGTFDILDKATGAAYEGLNLLEDAEDVGDEYDYSPCEEPLTVTSDGSPGTIRVLDAGNLAGRLEACFTLRLPEAIGEGRKQRSGEFAECPAVVRVGLSGESPIVDVEILFENRAEDHRLRAVFPTGIVSDSIVSDGHFYINRRTVDRVARPEWVQPPPDAYPQQDFSLVEDGSRGLALLNMGLPEISVRRDSGGRAVLSLTLLRAVGWLSRDDFPTRKFGNAGPTLHTPGAQCRGPQRFRYAVVPFRGDHVSAGIKQVSERWRTPTPAVQGVWQGHVPAGEGLLHISGSVIVASAIKKHETRDTLVVRLCNLSEDPVEERLTLGRPVRAAWRTNLLEDRIHDLETEGPLRVVVSLRPHEIATLEVEFEDDGTPA